MFGQAFLSHAQNGVEGKDFGGDVSEAVGCVFTELVDLPGEVAERSQVAEG